MARGLSKSVRRIGLALVMVVVVEYLVVPQLAGARKSLHLLGRVNVGFLVVAIALEFAAIVAYAQLTRAVLPQHVPSPPLGTVLRIDLATMSVSHTVPGGTAAGGALGYRLLTATGVTPTDAAFALGTQGIGSALVLNALLWLALMVSIATSGFNPLYGTAAVVGALLVGVLLLAVVSLTRGEERIIRVVARAARPIPLLDPEGLCRALRHVADRLRLLAADRALLLRAAAWASGNWLLDAASLWVFLGAFGHWVRPDKLFVCFGLANVLAAIPITPSGLGVVETVLTSSLIGFGAPRGVAILGVISYRLVNFWLPIPLGGLAYLSLKVGPAATREDKAEELRRAAERSMEERERTRQWAERTGLRVPRGMQRD